MRRTRTERFTAGFPIAVSIAFKIGDHDVRRGGFGEERRTKRDQQGELHAEVKHNSRFRDKSELPIPRKGDAPALVYDKTAVMLSLRAAKVRVQVTIRYENEQSDVE